MRLSLSPRGRAGRVGRGISASVIAQAIQAAQAIVLVPFFIRAWGVDGYGRWVTLSVLVSYLALLDLGGQSYVANLITIEYSRGNFDAFRARLGEAMSFFLLLGAAAFGVVVGALWVGLRVPVPFVARVITSSEAWVLALLAAYTLVLSVPGGLYVTLYRAVGKYARGAMLGNVFRVTALLIGIAVLVAKSSPAVYAAWYLGIGLLLTLALVWDSWRIVPELRGLKLGWRSALTGAGLLKGSLPFLLMGLAQGTSQQLLTTFLAAFRSPLEVGVFATHRTLASIPNYIGPLVQGPVLPEMSTLWGQERTIELKRIAMTAVRTVVFLTGAAALAVWVAGPMIFRLWTGRAIEVHPTLMTLLLLQAFLSAIWSTCTWGPLAANHHKLISRLWIASWGLTVGSALFFLVPRWGTEGAATSLLIGDVAFKLLGFPLAAGAFYNAPSTLVYRHALRGAAPLIPLLGLAVALKLLGGGVLLTIGCLACMAVATIPMMMLAMKESGSIEPGPVVPAEEGPRA
jgi:O-antigen/teichoic acid export membrane protein